MWLIGDQNVNRDQILITVYYICKQQIFNALKRYTKDFFFTNLRTLPAKHWGGGILAFLILIRTSTSLIQTEAPSWEKNQFVQVPKGGCWNVIDSELGEATSHSAVDEIELVHEMDSRRRIRQPKVYSHTNKNLPSVVSCTRSFPSPSPPRHRRPIVCPKAN